jgi:hypothetical protein
MWTQLDHLLHRRRLEGGGVRLHLHHRHLLCHHDRRACEQGVKLSNASICHGCRWAGSVVGECWVLLHYIALQCITEERTGMPTLKVAGRSRAFDDTTKGKGCILVSEREVGHSVA